VPAAATKRVRAPRKAAVAVAVADKPATPSAPGTSS